MLIVVADTGPLHYLVLIGNSEIFPTLFDKILVPRTVHAELSHPEAPDIIRDWAARPPGWLEVCPDPQFSRTDLLSNRLDEGELAALALAGTRHADLILMDDRDGVAVARQRGFTVTGTLGILDLAARRGLLDLAEAIASLRATNFRCRPELMDALLAQHMS